MNQPNEIRVQLEKAAILDECFQQIDRIEDLAIIKVVRMSHEGREWLQPVIVTNVSDPDRLNSLIGRLQFSLQAWMYGLSVEVNPGQPARLTMGPATPVTESDAASMLMGAEPKALAEGGD